MSRAADIDDRLVVQTTIQLVPPMIRESLLEDVAFRERLGISVEESLTFGEAKITLRKTALFQCLLNIVDSGGAEELVDENGESCKISVDFNKDELPIFFLHSNDAKYSLPSFALLSSHRERRVLSIERLGSEFGLTAIDLEHWMPIIGQRPLSGDEILSLHSLIENTSAFVSNNIKRALQCGKCSISELVPLNRDYYNTLVGPYKKEKSINDYAEGTFNKLVNQKLSIEGYEGILQCLPLAFHSKLMEQLDIDTLDNDIFVRVLEFLISHGDTTSKLGALEIGFKLFPDIPEAESLLIELLQQLRDEDIDLSPNGFRLLSALFVAVDGELSRMRVFVDAPPYYRRLASLAQSAFIQHQAIILNIEESFVDWVASIPSYQFYWQSLVDLRLEPRWLPDFASASTIKADYFGRLLIAAENQQDALKGSNLLDLVLGDQKNSIKSLVEFPTAFLPGPLEGAGISPIALPQEHLDIMFEQLKMETITPRTFVAMINSSLVFKIEPEHVELAASALNSANYKLANVKNVEQLLSVLDGLAVLAAVSRSNQLAEALHKLVRVYRFEKRFTIPIEAEIRICILSSASHESILDWREFVGTWLTELAFSDLSVENAKGLHTHLQCILSLVPELFVSCSRANAALCAFTGSE